MSKKIFMACGTVLALSSNLFAWTAGNLTVDVVNSPMDIKISAGTKMLLEISGSENESCVRGHFKNFIHKKGRAAGSVWRLTKKSRGAVEKLSVDVRSKRIRRVPAKKNAASALESGDPRFVVYAFSQMLASTRGALVHAAAVVRRGRAYLFFGKSGDGKSTAAELSRRYEVIGDDVIAIKKIGGDYFAFATPWTQKPFVKAASRRRAKIRAVFFLNKSRAVAFDPVSAPQGVATIIYNHVHFLNLTGRAPACRTFRTVSDLARRVPMFRMRFTKKGNFWPKLVRIVASNDDDAL